MSNIFSYSSKIVFSNNTSLNYEKEIHFLGGCGRDEYSPCSYLICKHRCQWGSIFYIYAFSDDISQQYLPYRDPKSRRPDSPVATFWFPSLWLHRDRKVRPGTTGVSSEQIKMSILQDLRLVISDKLLQCLIEHPASVWLRDL